jgi:hypothetical protein
MTGIPVLFSPARIFYDAVISGKVNGALVLARLPRFREVVSFMFHSWLLPLRARLC